MFTEYGFKLAYQREAKLGGRCISYSSRPSAASESSPSSGLLGLKSELSTPQPDGRAHPPANGSGSAWTRLSNSSRAPDRPWMRSMSMGRGCGRCPRRSCSRILPSGFGPLQGKCSASSEMTPRPSDGSRWRPSSQGESVQSTVAGGQIRRRFAEGPPQFEWP